MADGLVDDMGLVGEFRHLDPHRQVGGDLVHQRVHLRAEFQNVAARLHADLQADGGLGVETEQLLRGVFIAAAHRRHIGEVEEPVADAQVHRRDGVGIVELPVDADQNAFRPRFNHARGRDGVLIGQRGHDLFLVQAKGCQTRGREFQIDFLVLFAQQFDLARQWQRLHQIADIIHAVAQFARGEAVRREGIDIAEHVAEIVVELEAREFLREFRANVRHHLADALPDLGDMLAANGLVQFDIDDRLPRHGDRAGKVQLVQFLQLLLDPLGDLIQRLVNRGAGQGRADHHHLDGEVRVFLAPQIGIGNRPRQHRHDQQEPHKAAMFQRPVGQIEPWPVIHGSTLSPTACPSVSE